MTGSISLKLQCSGGKAVFDDFPAANRVAQRTNQTNRRTGRTTRKIKAYHCAEHKGWHLTGNTPKALKKEAA